MSALDVSALDKGLNWSNFTKAYAEEHGLTYGQAMVTAGAAWKEYKVLHGILTKQEQKDQNKPAAVVKKRKDLKETASGNKKKTIKAKAPPRGKKAVITYITDSEEEEEEEVKPKKKKVKPPPEPVKSKKKVVKAEVSEESDSDE